MRFKLPKLTVYNAFIALIAIIAIFPVLAPILLKLSENYQVFLWPARSVYFLYSFTCHQFHHRSLHFFDLQFAWCARDTGIWLGILAGALYNKRNDAAKLPWYWILPFVMPIALDGGIQTIATILGIQNPTGITGDILYVSNNFTRFLTGAIFGLGIGLIITPFLKTNFPKYEALQSSYLGKLALMFVPIVLFYLLTVQIWSLTSQKVEPSDLLDSAVKTPATELFLRRQNGACPTKGEELLSFSCD